MWGLNAKKSEFSTNNEAKAPAVCLDNIAKTYPGKVGVHALQGVSVSFASGTFTAIMGPSGSGKSTLLHCAAGLDQPSSGQVKYGDIDISRLREPKLTKVRRERVGFVFQSFNLIESLNVWQNVLLPGRLAGRRADKKWAREVLERVGLKGKENARPGELSGGQQQRVALARALAAKPEVLFADEPTGALDLRTGIEVLRLIRDAVDKLGQTVIMVTHDASAAAWADQVLFLADGELIGMMQSPTAQQISERMMELNTR
ncbi:ABC transporter ATP-binding protein [Paenibacillus methanolicus]|uniref:Putative ABC transport system ATP-binding protein n=1 Tax=Paenibacillus methanolicus TaxID=582686 RepID=A0A5S5BQN1_9BACL|nr:ABC transporter ATP-binding protein [Paenibacillus methanolicus]TYP69515.1 putative ABC transport system ATP-binding protein [Paenibacillus methanolicus]